MPGCERLPEHEGRGLKTVNSEFPARAANFELHLGRFEDIVVGRCLGQIELDEIVDRARGTRSRRRAPQ